MLVGVQEVVRVIGVLATPFTTGTGLPIGVSPS